MLVKAVISRESEIKIEMRKASFGGDRSEAGRYAANIRWQGNIKKTPKQNPNFAPNQSLKAKQDLLRIGAKHDKKVGNDGRDLTDSASLGLRHWVNRGTLDINTFLRTNSTKNLMYGNIDEKKALKDIKIDSQRMLDCWDELKEKTEEEIVVFRGLATKKSETFKVGSVISDKGWQSTTTDPVFATDWSRTASVFSSLDDQENLETTVFQIKIPKGTEIINLGGFVSELGYAYRTESTGVLSEVFLNRGTKYRVVATRNQKDGDAWAKRTKKKQYSDSIKIVELEVVP